MSIGLVIFILVKLALDIWSAKNKTVDAAYCGVALVLTIFRIITTDTTIDKILWASVAIAILVYAGFRFRDEKDIGDNSKDDNQSDKRSE